MYSPSPLDNVSSRSKLYSGAQCAGQPGVVRGSVFSFRLCQRQQPRVDRVQPLAQRARLERIGIITVLIIKAVDVIER